MNLRHHRRSIRLPGYDYTHNGAYFVTLCAHERRCLFGHIKGDQMVLNDYGRIVQAEWERTPTLRPNITLDAFVIMPNHFHAILILTDSVGATRRVAPTPSTTLQAGSLGAVIGQFKSTVTRRILKQSTLPDHPVWQRNYYEHIVRTEDTLNTIRTYILANPAQWAQDSLYTHS